VRSLPLWKNWCHHRGKFEVVLGFSRLRRKIPETVGNYVITLPFTRAKYGHHQVVV
jgi:hypothetical protein